jgi:hypothetical protein
MNDDIIQTIDAQIAALQQARAILLGTNIKRRPGRPRTTALEPDAATVRPAKRKKMSAEVRARMSAAQKTRWAKRRNKVVK